MKYKYSILTLLTILSFSWIDANAGFSGSTSRSTSPSTSTSRPSPSPTVSRPAPSTNTVAKTNAGSAVAAANQQKKAMSLYNQRTVPVTPSVASTKPTYQTPAPVSQPNRYTAPTAGVPVYQPNRLNVQTNRPVVTNTVVNNTTIVHRDSGSGLGTGLVVGAIAGAAIANSGHHDTVYVQQTQPVQTVQPSTYAPVEYTPAPVAQTPTVKSDSGSHTVIIAFLIAGVILILAVLATSKKVFYR